MKPEATLLHELVLVSAERDPSATALRDGEVALSYGELGRDVRRFAGAMSALKVGRGERVAIYLEKRREAVVASFGAPAHGAVFVPINPLLKPEQVGYILRDCNVRVLVTSAERIRSLARDARAVPGAARTSSSPGLGRVVGSPARAAVARWDELMAAAARSRGHRVIDTDMVGDPLHLRQHRPAQGRGAVAPQHGGGRQERRFLPGEPRRRRAAGRAAAVLRRRLQPADDRLSLPARASCCSTTCCRKDVAGAIAQARVTGLRPCRRCGSS